MTTDDARNTSSGLSASQRALLQKAERLTTPEFIGCRICPFLGPGFNGSPSDCRTTIVRNNGMGRLTIQYVFDPEVVVFAKLYDDSLGSLSYEANQALWNYGFNKTGRYRVPQPLGFLADHALQLMLGVQGIPLSAALHGDSSDDLVSGSQEAAQWLTTLHLSTLRVGSPEWALTSLKRCSEPDLIMKAITVQPDKADMVRDLVALVEQRTTALRGKQYLVLTHGRYHHDHVFLSPEATSAIDLDRCRPSDPAKDIAEFIRLMRLTAFSKGLAMVNVEQAISKFLSTYLAQLPHAADSLGCYLAAFTLHSLLRGLKQRSNRDTISWERIEAFHVQEVHKALDIWP